MSDQTPESQDVITEMSGDTQSGNTDQQPSVYGGRRQWQFTRSDQSRVQSVEASTLVDTKVSDDDKTAPNHKRGMLLGSQRFKDSCSSTRI